MRYSDKIEEVLTLSGMLYDDDRYEHTMYDDEGGFWQVSEADISMALLLYLLHKGYRVEQSIITGNYIVAEQVYSSGFLRRTYEEPVLLKALILAVER